MKKKLQVLMLSISALAGGGFSLTAQADVIGFVENENIGLVTTHAINPNGRFVYSTTISPSPTTLFVHSRDPNTGEILDQIQSLEAKDFTSTVADPSFHPGSMAVSPDGKQIYIAAIFGKPGDATLNFKSSVLRFDVSASGTLTYVNRVIVSGSSDGLTISPNGKFMYVADYVNGNQISVIKRASNGNITTVQTNVSNPAGSGVGTFSISPDSKNLYASSDAKAHLHVYSINQSDGSLTYVQSFISAPKAADAVAGDIVTLGSGGSGSVISQDGKFLYTVGGRTGVDDSITIFKRNNDGTLNFFKNVKAPLLANSNTQPIIGSSSVSLAMNKNQKYIYAFDDNYSGFIGVWKRNQTTGDLAYIGLVKGDGLGQGVSETFELAKDGSTLNINVGNGISVYDLRSDLNIVKSGPSTNVTPNGTISYTLAVTNNGSSDAQNVVVTDTLPAGTSFISGTNNNTNDTCTASGQKVTCKMGQILNNDGYNAIVQVKAPSAEGTITNTASVTADQLDSKTADNSDSVTTTIKKGGSTLPPVTGGGTGGSGGGSIPLSLFVLLLPALLRRRLKLIK